MLELPNFKLEVPPDDSTLWRYMSLSALVWLIDKGIFFRRADKLGDRFEGSTPNTDVGFRKHVARAEGDAAVSDELRLERLRSELPRHVAISCWHENMGESAAMWSIYAARGGDVAVRTTTARLTNVLEAAEHFVTFGKILYLPYETDRLKDEHPLVPFFRKRRSFEHECEVRALITDSDLSQLSAQVEISAQQQKAVPTEIVKSVCIPADPNALIEAIYCAPGSKDWHYEAVQAAATALGFTGPIHRSALDDPAVY